MNVNIDLKQADNGTGSVRRNRFGEVQGEKQLSIKKKDRYKQSLPMFKKQIMYFTIIFRSSF